MSNKGIVETPNQFEVSQIEANIPQLEKIEMDRDRFDPILEDVISDHISKYGLCQLLGTLILSVFGIVASLYSSDWDNCHKSWFIIISILLGGSLLVVPYCIKSKKDYTKEVVRIIDENISCMQSYNVCRDDWDAEVENRRAKANEEADAAIASIKKQKRKTNQKLKRTVKRRHP